MDVNGENMDKRWQRVTLALELIIGAQWLLVVPFANKYVHISLQEIVLVSFNVG